MNMAFPTTTLLVLFACLTLPGMPAAADFEVDVEISESIDTSRAKAIDIDFGVGELYIKQAEGDEIEVKGEILVQGWREDRVVELADAMGLIVETGEVLSLRLPRERYGVDYRIDLTVFVPAGLDLDIRLAVGILKADIELPNRANMRMGAGDLDVNLPSDTSAQINAKVSIGELEVYDFDNESDSPMHRRFLSKRYKGAIGKEGLADKRDLHLRVKFGEIEIRGRG